jgi:hypothetical protein
MFRVGVLAAACISICGCAAQTTTPPAAAAAQQTKRVCTTVKDESTGSLIGTRQVCKDAPVDPATTPQR